LFVLHIVFFQNVSVAMHHRKRSLSWKIQLRTLDPPLQQGP